MRLALVSDIHGNLPALEAVVADIARRGVDAVINLGDSLSGPLLPLETARYLMAQPWTHLAGNHERQVLSVPPHKQGPSDRYAREQLDAAALDWIARQQPLHRYSEEIFLCHASPRSDVENFLDTVEGPRMRPAMPQEIEERLGQTQEAVVACGHTHVPRAVRSRRGQLLVNPGSVGLQAFDGTQPNPHAVEIGSPDARYAILEKRGGAWQAQFLAVPYDFLPMARLAAQRGQRGWEAALATGYMSR